LCRALVDSTAGTPPLHLFAGEITTTFCRGRDKRLRNGRLKENSFECGRLGQPPLPGRGSRRAGAMLF